MCCQVRDKVDGQSLMPWGTLELVWTFISELSHLRGEGARMQQGESSPLPQKCPHPNPLDLRIYYLTWQGGIKVADRIKGAKQLTVK